MPLAWIQFVEVPGGPGNLPAPHPPGHPTHPIEPGGGGEVTPPWVPPPTGIWPPKPGVWPPRLPPNWPDPPEEIWPPIDPAKPSFPIALPPGTIWPPLPPHYPPGKAVVLVLIPNEGWHWAVIEIPPPQVNPQPPTPSPTGPPR